MGVGGAAGDSGCVRAYAGDLRGAARRAVEANLSAGAEKAACRVDIIGWQDKAADVDHAAGADQDAAGIIEPDVAPARSARRSDISVDRAVERDLAAERSAAAVHEAVEDRIIAGADEIPRRTGRQRSEEHTSELQSLMRISYAVFCLKKKKQTSLYQ